MNAKRVRTLVAVAITMLAGLSLRCLGARLYDAPAAGSGAPLYQELASYIMLPWVSSLLLVGGMVFVTIGSLMPRGRAGLIGVLPIALVITSSSVVGTLAPFPLVLVLSGAGLVLMETYVLPGRGVYAGGGVICLFIGFMGVQEAAGAPVCIASSALAALMAMASMLVYIPRSPRWRSLYNEAASALCRPHVEAHTGVVSRVQVSGQSQHARSAKPTTGLTDRGLSNGVGRAREAASIAVDRELALHEDPAVIGPQIVESIRAKLLELREASVPVLAEELRLARLLESSEGRLAELEAGARQAVMARRDDLAEDLLSRRDCYRGTIEDLRDQFNAAKTQADRMRARIDSMQDELVSAGRRVLDASCKSELAGLMRQTQQLMQEGLEPLRQMEDRLARSISEIEAACDPAHDAKSADFQTRYSARAQRAKDALSNLKSELGNTPRQDPGKQYTSEEKPQDQQVTRRRSDQ